MRRLALGVGRGWESVLKPILARLSRQVLAHLFSYFRADAGLASPDVDEHLEGEGIKYAIRLPANRVLQEMDRLPPQAPCRPPFPRCPTVLRELHLAGRKLDETPPAIGIAPMPCESGGMHRNRSIGRAGNPRARTTLIQLAWLWLRHQPGSALSDWFRGRVGTLQGRTPDRHRCHGEKAFDRTLS
jgi:hypothetical protein